MPVRLETLQCLAKALVVDVRDIASDSREGAAGSEGQSRLRGRTGRPDRVERETRIFPPRTPLRKTMIDLERAAGVDTALIDTARGPVEPLTAKRLQDVLTAYALYDGDRFCLRGVVSGMRAVAPSEAQRCWGAAAESRRASTSRRRSCPSIRR